MKIGINAIGLNPSSTGGAEIYFRNLIQYVISSDTKNSYYIFLNNKALKKSIQKLVPSNTQFLYFSKFSFFFSFPVIFFLLQPQNFIKLLINFFSRIIFSKKIFFVDTTGIIGKIINFDNYNLDVIHFLFGTIDPSMLKIKLPIVLTLFDVLHEFYPAFFDQETLFLREKLYKSSAERADTLITISEHAQNSIIEKFHINPKKIVLIYLGCSKNFKKQNNSQLLETIKKKYHLPNEFMLFPASFWPHKNHVKLLEALALLRDEKSFEKTLVLTGIPLAGYTDVLNTIQELNLENTIKFLSFVPFDDLPIIYNLATIMVFPSLFEGFGMPILEALNVGLPIACSDRTSIPEIAGDAALYFNPESAKDMGEKIFSLWHNHDLRKQLVSKGFKRTEKFLWGSIATKTINTYENAVTSKSAF